MTEAENFSKIERSSDKSFGMVFTIVFLIIALYPMIKSNNINLIALIISIVFFLFTFIRPQSLALLNILWQKFGKVLGGIVAPIVMFFVYFFTVVPTGLIMRLLGKDLLTQKINKNVDSYWVKRDKPIGSMKNQF